MMVFVIGHNCSGENQINWFLRNNDYRTKMGGEKSTLAWDMHENKYHNKKPLEGYHDYEAFLLMETLDPHPYYASRSMFQDLDRIYEHSIFIFNYIDEATWINKRLEYMDGKFLEAYKKFYRATDKNVVNIWKRQNKLFQNDLSRHFRGNKKDRLILFDLNNIKDSVERVSFHLDIYNKEFKKDI